MHNIINTGAEIIRNMKEKEENDKPKKKTMKDIFIVKKKKNFVKKKV